MITRTTGTDPLRFILPAGNCSGESAAILIFVYIEEAERRVEMGLDKCLMVRLGTSAWWKCGVVMRSSLFLFLCFVCDLG